MSHVEWWALKVTYSADIVAIFEPVIEQVIALLREQVKASIHFRTKAISRTKFKIEVKYSPETRDANVANQSRNCFSQAAWLEILTYTKE